VPCRRAVEADDLATDVLLLLIAVRQKDSSRSFRVFDTLVDAHMWTLRLAILS